MDDTRPSRLGSSRGGGVGGPLALAEPNRPTWPRQPRPAAQTPPDSAVGTGGSWEQRAGTAHPPTHVGTRGQDPPGQGTPSPCSDEFPGSRARRIPNQPRRSGRASPRPHQMFAIQPGLAEGAQFVGSLPPGVCQPELQPDSNSNFMENAKDANENWHGMPGKVEPILMRNSSELPSDNQAFQGTGFPEGRVRSPPEGAEISGAEPEKLGGAGSICSPLEDIGYASSSLSIDSLSSSPESSCETPGGPGTPDPLLPCVAQAVQQLQAQERYKELEKEKHHVHLVMYRRLALLQWIRALQHQLVDQQSRLQESFDTILDNRKELIRCLQQRAAPSTAQDQG